MKRLLTVLPIALVCAQCTKETQQSPAPPVSKPAPAPEPFGNRSARAIDGPTLLLAQAQFSWEEENGKRIPKPGAAKLRILHRVGGEFTESVLEDEQSRVFHKALCVNNSELDGLLTIGATDAHLKLWKYERNTWQSTTLWTGHFGGKFDRLRDIEVGDVDGDGRDEYVIATHDQGVVAIVEKEDGGWRTTEVFKKPDTFVHEIELGDIDGDGRLEIYATPSKPNRANASQSGDLLSIRYTPKSSRYESKTIVTLENSHAKEILVDDLDGDGTDELYAAVEASIKPVNGKLTVDHPVAVRRFDPKGAEWTSIPVAEFPNGLQSRVLLLADLTNRGQKDLVVTTMKDGIWRVIPKSNDRFELAQIDQRSGGFEHAAHVADLDADGTPELYVTSDDDDEVRRYVWNGKSFDKSVIASLEKSDLVWNITSCL